MIWCDESRSWYTDSDDIPGLTTGAKTFDDLVEKVRNIAPELLKDNLGYVGPIEIQFEAERYEFLQAVS